MRFIAIKRSSMKRNKGGMNTDKPHDITRVSQSCRTLGARDSTLCKISLRKRQDRPRVTDNPVRKWLVENETRPREEGRRLSKMIDRRAKGAILLGSNVTLSIDNGRSDIVDR